MVSDSRHCPPPPRPNAGRNRVLRLASPQGAVITVEGECLEVVEPADRDHYVVYDHGTGHDQDAPIKALVPKGWLVEFVLK